MNPAPALLAAGLIGLCAVRASAGGFRVKEGVPGDKTVGADTVSEITWTDRVGADRTVQFVTRSAKWNPGWLAQYRYDGITVNAVDEGSGGLTDVSHNGGMLKVKGHRGWSSRGHTITWAFRGAHHGIVRVEYEMPFTTGEKGDKISTETIRVVRDLVFADGTDPIVYAITLDFAKVPKDKASIDTRSPYMRWDWDGSGGGMGPYTGFKSGTDGTLVCENTQTSTGRIVKTLNDNTIPYNYQWNSVTNRCVAIIGTRPYAELPQGSECWAGNPDPILPAGTWTRDQVEAWKLPYQVGGYSGWIEKLTWQVPFNLGHEKVVVGSHEFSAWPRYSYSTLVLLDRLDRKSFERLLAEQERMPSVKASAAVGSVMTETPPGPGREKERTPLKTSGYDPTWRAWRFACAGNHADVTIDPETGTLDHPVVVFDGYHGATAPAIPGALVSLDRQRGRVWVTVLETPAGPVHVRF